MNDFMQEIVTMKMLNYHQLKNISVIFYWNPKKSKVNKDKLENPVIITG